jgi:hypothetical protein
MIYFLIFPLWVVMLSVCAIMAFFVSSRRIAIHLALMSTFAVWLSFLLSLALALGFGALIQFSSWAKLGVIVGYIVGVIGGGLLGAVLGHFLAEKLAPLGLWSRFRQLLA